PVMRLFQLHNIAAHRFLRNFAIDKEKPVWMFEQMQECLQGVFPAYADERNETIREDVQKLLEVCTHMIQSREKLRRIYDRGVEGHNQMRARGYVIPADETHLYDCLYESDYILYERLRIQELIWSSLDRLSAFFSHGNPKLSKEMEKKRKKLVDLLNDYKKKKLKVITDKSVSSFEIGITGQRTVFQSAEHLKEIYQIENELVFKKDCVPLLRNP
ncbi:MAG TPA: hypothetical protein VE710_22065, partial [Candidatus Bathyarchaeia archaeon]|nr:hypothetical protein [Candidatus Bathyarchaeia archaeon]